MKLEVQIAVSAELLEQLDAGRLDVVFAKRPLGTSKGRLVWREPLVWGAADTFDLIPGAALPLALYRERSVSREAALAALQEGELTWKIVYTSPSLTGVRAAALAGLAINATSGQRSHRRLAHSRCRGRIATAPRSRVRDIRKGKVGQRRSGTRRSSAGARARSIAPDDVRKPK